MLIRACPMAVLSALCALILAVSAQAAVKSQKFEDWSKDCLESNGQITRCQISQALVDKKGRKIISFSVQNSKTGPILEVSAPLGLLIPFGVRLQFDKRPARQMQLVDCNRNGCRAVIALGQDALQEATAGKDIVISFSDSKSGKLISLSGSLKGFSAAIKSLGL